MSTLDVAVELGPRGRKVAAWATRWPGLERGGATPEEALARLEQYRERYALVARRAGRGREFTSTGPVRVVARYPGTGSTDFWGISFASCALDEAPQSAEETERALEILAGAWAVFDDARTSVSARLRRGPRGGGRDREAIAAHVLSCEQDWARKLAVTPDGDLATDPAALARHREAYRRAVRDHRDEGRRARTWTLPFLVRHSAYHVLDHAWEMHDRDLGPAGDPPRST